MKFTSVQRLKRVEFMRWGKRIASSGCGDISPATVHTRKSPYMLRQLFWKLKSQLKHILGWHNTKIVHYNYDLHSYNLNFDDGFLV